MPHLRWCLMSLILAWASLTQATVYWVHPSQGTTGNCGNAIGATEPLFFLRSIQAGVSCATAAGDIVNVKAGSYTETVNSWTSGASGNPIIVRANPGDTVTWTGPGTNQDSTTTGAIQIQDRSHITIQGFTFQNTIPRATIFLVKNGTKTSASNVVGISITNNQFLKMAIMGRPSGIRTARG